MNFGLPCLLGYHRQLIHASKELTLCLRRDDHEVFYVMLWNACDVIQVSEKLQFYWSSSVLSLQVHAVRRGYGQGSSLAEATSGFILWPFLKYV